MEDICKNCKCFALMCPATDECLWGICKKPVADAAEVNDKKGVVFKWAEDTCPDFESKPETKSRHLQKWLEPLKKMLKIS